MNDWKELVIGNIPMGFLEEDNYEVQFKAVNDWREENSDKKEVLHLMIDKEYKYRYRRKPLENIKMTKEEHHSITFGILHANKAVNGEHITKAHFNNAMSAMINGLESVLRRTGIIGEE